MELIDLGKNPISGDNPAGEDVRYDPDFEELQGEIDKLSIATTGTEGCDWNKVVKLGSEILADKSKNLQAAAYLSQGLIKTRAIEGLSIGTAILADLVENYWDTMYPPKKRMRGRVNTLTWWMDNTEAYLQTFSDTTPLPAEMVENIKQNLDRLDQGLSEKTDEAPYVGKLRSYIDRLPVESPPAEEPAEAEPSAAQAEAPPSPQAPKDEAAKAPDKSAAPAPPPRPSSPPAAAVGDIKTPADADRVVGAAMDQLALASDFFLAADLANPLAYRLTRLAAWLPLDRLPVADGNKTMIPPPDSTILSSIENLISGRDYVGAINAAEGRVRQYLFWLDLSRLTAEALDAQGEPFQAAKEALEAETLLLVKKLAGVENLAFSDGTPFANGATKGWLKSLTSAGAPQAMDSSGDPEAGKTAEALAKAQELIRNKKITEGVRLIEDGLSRTGAGRSRLLWRMAMVQVLVLAGRPDLARPHLFEIASQIKDLNLEIWEPNLAVSGLKIVYEGLTGDESEEIQAKASETRDWIARISPTAALGLMKS